MVFSMGKTAIFTVSNLHVNESNHQHPFNDSPSGFPNERRDRRK